MKRSRAFSAMLASVAALGSAAEAQAAPVPMIFVHGQSGSAQQFETNTMRFASNGFPRKRIFVYEYNTLEGSNDTAIANLDGFIADVKERTGSARVDVLAHSRGTTVMHSYLATPERAASVRRYVNFDGRSSDSPPGGVPTLAIWGEGDQTRAIEGATNVYFPNRAHTEVTTSAASFLGVYEFLTGEPPATKSVVPEPPDEVKVAGRALDFPTNEGMAGARLKVFELEGSTGARVPGKPVYKKVIGADGAFGPFEVNGRKHYEFAVKGAGETVIHNYPEPFERDDFFYRVLNAPLLAPFIERSPAHTSVAVTRMREWWGDQSDPGATDRLEFNGVNVINPAIAPRARRVLAVFNFDEDSDRTTDLSEPVSPFSSISFLTAADNYMPSSADASGTIAVKETSRGHREFKETINVPNWPSEEHTVSVFFRDYDARAFRRP